MLNQLRTSIIDALKQTGEEGTAKDGMDMSIIAINKNRKRALWAGANNPLYVIKNSVMAGVNSMSRPSGSHSPLPGISTNNTNSPTEITEIKGDKMPVSIHINMEPFTNHEIELNSGDIIYLFTDGYPDQFGGPKGKKFKYMPFKELLVENANKPMLEQKEALEAALDEWIGHINPDDNKSYEQIDDITVLGLKI